MKLLVVILSVFGLACASDVIDLTDDNFDDEVGDKDIMLVEFYAPWCGHCKKLVPEYEAAATKLKDNDPPVPLAKIDCVGEGKEKCSKYGVSGYPTLKIFKNGEISSDYQGPRQADGIVKYMKSKAGPSSKTLDSAEAVEAFLAKDETVIVGFFKKEDGDLAKTFKKLSDSLNEDFTFGHSTNADALKKYGENEVAIFQPKRLQNKFEDASTKYDGKADSLSSMKTWVNDNVHGLCGHRTSDNQEQFKKPLVVAFYDVDYAKNPKGTNYWRNRVMKVGKKIRDAGKSVYFAISSSSEFSSEISDQFGLSGKDKPVVGAWNAKGEKFVMADEFSMDTLETFVNDFLDGKVESYMKSEPLPEDDDSPVKTLVARNFDDIVNNKDKDVLIEFYAPWCGHCKSLAPKYEELATKLADEDDIVIAKMDATANDVPATYKVQGFPTLFFVPKGSKDSPKLYNGGREVDEFIKYLAAESTDELKGFNRKGQPKKKEL